MDIIKGLIAFFVGVFTIFASFAGIVILMGLLWAIPTMLLWDWLMPDLFGLQEITIWQAWGINVLSGILFKAKINKAEKKEGKKKSMLHS